MQQLIKYYTTEKKRLTRLQMRFEFLKKCNLSNVQPKHLTITNNFATTRLQRIVKTCENKLLKAEIRDTRRLMFHQYNKVYTAYNNIIQQFHQMEADDIFRRAQFFCDSLAHNIRRKHASKLRNLILHQPKVHPTAPNQQMFTSPTTRYINLSTYLPNSDEENILNTSPKYAYSNHTKSSNQLIPQFEQAICQLPISKQVEARMIVHKTISFHRTHNNALHNKEKKDFRIISNLKNNPLINIVASDKSNQLVLYDKSVFKEKTTQCINDLHAIQVYKDPTPSLITKLSALKKNKQIPPEILKRCFPPLYPDIPKLFFQAKIHKKDQPLRPLVARYNAPTYNLERATTNYLQPFFSNHQYTVSSSYQFKDRIRNIQLPDEFQFHTMDATQLFPSIPTEEAKNLILEKLRQNNIPSTTTSALSSVLNLILSNVFFKYDDKTFKQTQGAPMGLSLSPLLAECIMQHIESTTFSIIPPPTFYQRYVDDIFLIINNEHNNFQDIFYQFNHMYPSIKFTTETNTNNNIPFLDMLIHTNYHNIEIDIYRKPTYTPNIIPYNSHHPPSHKWAFFKSLIFRAIHLPTQTTYSNNEITYLKRIATSNAYPIHTLQHIINRNQRNHHLPPPRSTTNTTTYLTTPKPKIKYITLPYFSTIHQLFNRLLKQTHYRLSYSSCPTISALIKSDRQRSKPTGGVYAIPFKNSPHIYIGRTKRSLTTRLKEHQYNLRSNNQATALTHYVRENNQTPLFSQATILSSPSTNFLLNYSEAIEIYINKKIAINTNSAIFVNHLWTDLLQKTAKTIPTLPLASINNNQPHEEEEDALLAT